MSAPVSSPAPQRLLGGRYRLSRRIATGGTAEVWEATDETLKRPVAIKILHPHLALDHEVRERFRREAVAAARLHHPAIVRVFDTCTDGEEALVMELVRGRTLRALLADEGPLDSVLTASLGAVVAEALHHAHEAGLVHRDVKPSNILLSHDGRVLLADLGIAKVADGADLTRTDVGLLGTARYLSPEQVEGGPVDPRTDVYGLGVVLYEAVCGRPPFEADNVLATALQRLHRDPLRPRQIRPDITRGLDEVVVRALCRDPDHRFQSAQELRAALLSLPGVLDADLAAATARPGRPSDWEVASEGETGDHQRGAATNLASDDATHSEAPDRTRIGREASAAAAARYADSEKRWLLPAMLIVFVAASLAVAGLLFSSTEVGQRLFEGARDAVTGRGATPLAITGAGAFDPGGDGHEHDDTTPLVLDGNPATVWTTEGYNERGIGTKAGVGIVLTLDGEQVIERLDLQSPVPGWGAEIRVAAAPQPSLEGWSDPVGQVTDGGANESVDLGGRRAGAVLIWITDLGRAGPPFRFELGEVKLFG
jgi:serine/threonine-protein kinase